MAALAATTLSSASFTDQGPPPPRTSQRERLLVGFDRESWTVDEFIIRNDGSRRFLSRFTVECGDLGGMVEYMLFMDEAEATQTPAQKKKQLLDAGIASCCGEPVVCDNFCGCIINVEQLPSGAAGGSSSWCKCADEEPNGDCPDDWPNGST